MVRDSRESIAAEVDEALASLPGVELYDVQLMPAQNLVRVLIERDAGGVDLALCEEVSRRLVELRGRHGLEVSSPGLERPLVRPAHYQRAVGAQVKVKLGRLVAGRKTLAGTVAAASEESFRLDEDGDVIEIPYDAVQRCTTVWNPVKAR